MIVRGDIRWFRFEAPDKRRPVLVLGRDDVLPSLAQVDERGPAERVRTDAERTIAFYLGG